MARVMIEEVLIGSRGVQQKRQECVEVVNTFIGTMARAFVMADFFERHRAKVKVQENAIEFDLPEGWTLIFHMWKGVSIRFNDGWTGTNNWTFQRKGDKDVPAASVRLMHPKLQALSDGIMCTFPGLETSLYPILEEARASAPRPE